MKIKLNSEQKRAVNHKRGPLLIIAGAGTGKTTVVTKRITNLILRGNAKPSEILALTFTEKASREMEDRVDVGLPYGYTQMWISTFHSFCDRVLRSDALHIGLDPKYKLMSTSESTQFLRNNLFKLNLNYFAPLGNPTRFVGALLQHFSRLQDEDISPKDYSAWANKVSNKTNTDEQREEIAKWKELSGAYQVYTELKIKHGLVDFGDLITNTLALFRKRKSVLKKYKRQFKYVLVDEYQDTNVAQNELVKLLAGKQGNITVVADDDQSIYKWRGAAVSNVVQFRKSFPKTKVITLTKNYRSSQEILDKSYQLIQFNNPDRLEVVEKVDKKLVAQRSFNNSEVGFIHTDRVENEAELVANKIQSLLNDSQTLSFKDFAILVRANNHADPFVRALSRKGIPHQFLGPGKLFNQPEVADLVSYLRVLSDPTDSVSLYRVLSMPALTIDQRDLVKISNVAKKLNTSFYEAAKKKEIISIASKDTQSKLIKFLRVAELHLKKTRQKTAGQLLYAFLEEMELIHKLLNPDSKTVQRKAINISKLFDKLKTYEVDHEDASVATVVDWIDLATEIGELPLASDSDWMQTDAVNILTIHSAKGLEFPAVFLVNLVGQRFPTTQRSEVVPIPQQLIKEILPVGDYHIQEERRLFYVGMTRARERLFFTAANYYGEGKREKRLSPFIFEALGDEVVSSESLSKVDQLSFSGFESPKSEIHTSDPELHIDFLSYSQIQTFKICPLHYKLRYLLKIPTPTTAALSFGTSMHEAMRDFYKAVKSGEKPNKRMLKALLASNWVEYGYKSKSHRDKMFDKGVGYLSGYLKSGYNPETKTSLIEQSFVVPVKAPKGEGRLKIGGKIDRVDDLANGVIEIVDYKTSEKVPTQKEVDKDLQLTFYALAATKINEKPFDKKPDEVKLSLYFFKEQTKISTSRTSEQLKQAEKEILGWRSKIEKSGFVCSKGFLCLNCEYGVLCRT